MVNCLRGFGTLKNSKCQNLEPLNHLENPPLTWGSKHRLSLEKYGNISEAISSCHLTGYQNPNLTW